MMKKTLIAIMMLMGMATATAQSLILINGTQFNIVCDEATLTAEIVDSRYKPDENRYPMADQSRYFREMDFNINKIVEVPAEITIYGHNYRITKIGNCAFADFQNVKSVYIPETVTEIGDYAFFRSSVEEVYVSASVKKIGKRAFGHCRKLRSLSLPAQLDYVGDRLYSESKKVIVTRSMELDELAEQRQQAAEANAAEKVAAVMDPTKKANRTSSTIDRNIPLNTTNNMNTYAVIIANEKYENEADVAFAINDGLSFRDYCQQTLGIPKDNIHLRTNATLNHIINEIEWLTKIDSPSANIILYYAGHGIPDAKTGKTFLLPCDGNGHITRTGYNLGELYSQLNDLEAERVVVFLDACFSGTKRDETMMESARGGVAIKAKPQDPMGKIIVFSATQDDQTAHSYDDESHGMFTYYLLKKLQESHGTASLGELAEYVNTNVVNQSRRKNNKIQTPTVSVGKNFGLSWRDQKLYNRN